MLRVLTLEILHRVILYIIVLESYLAIISWMDLYAAAASREEHARSTKSLARMAEIYFTPTRMAAVRLLSVSMPV